LLVDAEEVVAALRKEEEEEESRRQLPTTAEAEAAPARSRRTIELVELAVFSLPLLVLASFALYRARKN
jgi:hypothetical protein